MTETFQRPELSESQRKAWLFLMSAGALCFDSETEFEEEFATDPEYALESQFEILCEFFWACADGESIPVDELEKVARLFQSYGYNGLWYWIFQKRGWHWSKTPFRDYQRGIQFVENEERIRARCREENKSYYWTTDEYEIKVITPDQLRESCSISPTNSSPVFGSV